MNPLVVAAILVLVPALYVAVVYNALIALRNHVRESWGNIDTELKRRYDLIPNLVAVVKGYARHEQAVLERVIEIRNRCRANEGETASQAADERQLVGAVRELLGVVERYPELKADRHYLELQRELINTEDRIQAARRFFNGNVRDYRNRRELFPSSLVAAVFGFGPMDFFEVESSVREAPAVSGFEADPPRSREGSVVSGQ